MKIIKLMTNHLVNPIGYDFSYINLSWEVVNSMAAYSKAVRIIVSTDSDMTQIVYDTKVLEEFRECSYKLQIKLNKRTRYYWRVWVIDELGEEGCSETAYFETGKCREEWIGEWIGVKESTERMPCIYKEFEIEKALKQARLYIYGVGVYEVFINGKKSDCEYLKPGYHSYDLLMEYQTIDITNVLDKGKNRVEIVLGEGWYKGRFGFDGEFYNLYGNQKKCIAEIRLSYNDNNSECIVTDKTWSAIESNILNNGIYDGENIDDTLSCNKLDIMCFGDSKKLLCDRTNPPVHKVESFKPVSITEHKAGYLLLDFGEMITGWVEFKGELNKGQKISLYYGEILQDGAFYNDNLRSAKSEFTYLSDGKNNVIEPHFTYYGFRYVKVTGIYKGQLLEFKAHRIMSDIIQTGYITTSNEKVNKLIENTLRSQKCNFLDIPTDCPQRDERMGWTGDVAIFAKTACFHMNGAAFFRHYARSLYKEQMLLKGAVPFFSPKPKIQEKEGINPFYVTEGACAWGDVATILPWTLYEYYGDKELLNEQYPMMCGWVDYITKRSEENEVLYLWQNDRQLGDWLALDNNDINNPIGNTDSNMLASAYYYYSALLCSQAAEVLKDKRELELKTLASNIKYAFLKYYFDEDLELNIEPTQTGCAMLLYLGLYPHNGKMRLVNMLKQKLIENDGYLNTGFIGTPVLCNTLSENGLNSMAYDLLLNENYPGWLYEVNMGATTVWERWNSINSDGHISDTGMNSLNHYAYGSIADWIYRYVCGFRPSMNEHIKMTIKPMPDKRLKMAEASWNSIYGKYKSGWIYNDNEEVVYSITIPFNANAKVILKNDKTLFLKSGTYCVDNNGNFK